MREDFNNSAAGPVADRPTEKPATLTLRLSSDERKRLERDAAGMSLSAYVRDRLFGAGAKPRRTRGKVPVKDRASLARVLRQLGGSTLYNGMHRLLLAQEEGRLGLDHNLEGELRTMTRTVEMMRDELVQALGLRP